MPRKGKSGKGSNAKKGQSRKQRSNKSGKANKQNKSSGKQKQNQNPKTPQNGKQRPQRNGQSFSKEILAKLKLLNQLLDQVPRLSGEALWYACGKMDVICEELKKLQSSGNPFIWGFEDSANVSDEVLLDRLTLWIQKETEESSTGIIDKFKFKTDLPEGRGVIATKKLNQGEHTMSIPRKLMMTNGYALNKSDEKFRQFVRTDKMCNNLESLVLVLFVWYERMKGKASFWKPYLDALPTQFGLPHEAKTDDLRAFLERSLILEKICRLKINHLRYYTYCRHMLSKAGIEPGLRLVDYLWAVRNFDTVLVDDAIYIQRQNRIPSEKNPEKNELAMIPAWDMCNYKEGTVTTYFNTKQQRNEMFTMEEVAEGEQIYIFYGSQRNELLYLNSGFVAKENPNDELELTLRLDKSDPLHTLKLLQLKNAKLTNPIRILLPVIHHKRNDAKKITLNAETLDASIEEVESKISQQISSKDKLESNGDSEEKKERIFADDDVSTEWMLHTFGSRGLSLPPAAIRFSRLMAMTKEEIQGFMQKFYAKKKNNDADTVLEEVVELGVKSPVRISDDLGEPRELVSIENELKAWQVVQVHAEKMCDWLGKTLKLCVDAHIDKEQVHLLIEEKDEIEVIYGDDDPNAEMKDDAVTYNAAKVIKALRESGKHHVALTFDLIQIEQEHYKEAVEVMKEGIRIIGQRLNKVLNANESPQNF